MFARLSINEVRASELTTISRNPLVGYNSGVGTAPGKRVMGECGVKHGSNIQEIRLCGRLL
jgi:hypothetical protein